MFSSSRRALGLVSLRSFLVLSGSGLVWSGSSPDLVLVLVWFSSNFYRFYHHCRMCEFTVTGFGLVRFFSLIWFNWSDLALILWLVSDVVWSSLVLVLIGPGPCLVLALSAPLWF